MAFALAPSTLGSYISSVRTLLNSPDSTNSFWSDQELAHYINEGVRLYFLDVTQNDEGAWTKTVDLDISTDVETVALPSDCFEVKAVYKKLSSGFIVLPYRNAESDSYTTRGGSGTETYYPSYYFRENNLVLRPIPNFTETASLKVEYIYFPEVLAQAGDTMSRNVLPIFRQVVEMYAVYKAKLKESLVNGTDTSSLAKQNFNELYKQFIDTVQRRSKYPQYIKAFSPESTW